MRLPIDELYFQMPNSWVSPCKIYPYEHLKAIYRQGWKVRDDVVEWLEENNIKVDFIHELEGQRIHLIHFRSKSDAIQFKLVWAGQ